MIQELNNQISTILAAEKGFILFGRPSFARLYYRDYSVNLLTMQKEPEGLNALRQSCQQRHFFSTDEHHHRVTHFFYESGYQYLGLDCPADKPLAIDLIYQDRKECLDFHAGPIDELTYQLAGAPSSAQYENAFAKGYEALLRGDCYQFNLTYPFDFKLQKSLSHADFLTRLWANPQSRGAYAHATSIPALGQLYFSNSPECLFQVYRSRGDELLFESMPIKGTYKITPGQTKKDAINFFLNSLKDQGELNMITDLLRNDLSRISRPYAQVNKQFDYLSVPGLFHQFSRIQVKTSSDVTVDQVMASMFPGGSITGAPKKRVMEILQQIEATERGFYCGSTLIQSEQIHAASINIRSGLYQSYQQSLRLHAGGGVTLRSEQQQEWDEMWAKINSVIQLLGRFESVPYVQNELSDTI